MYVSEWLGTSLLDSPGFKERPKGTATGTDLVLSGSSGFLVRHLVGGGKDRLKPHGSGSMV